MSEIVKCKYAGDENDEFCAQCDGVNLILDDGSQTIAPECGGYEPVTNEVVQAVVKNEEPQPLNPTTDHAAPSDSHETTPSGTITPPSSIKGVTVEIQAESGVSLEVNGTWYKLAYTEKRTVPADADMETERKALWDDVNAEVDRQVSQVK